MLFADGTASGPVGPTKNTLSRLDFKQARKATSLTMWPTSDSSKLARLRITTNLDQTFEHGDLGVKIISDLVLDGVWTSRGNTRHRTRWHLEQPGMPLLDALQISRSHGCGFIPDPSGLTQGISRMTSSHAKFSNPGSNGVEFTFQDSVTITNTGIYNVAVADMYGVFATVSASFFGTTAGAKPVWNHVTTKTTTISTTTDLARQWNSTGGLVSRKVITCTATHAQGEINVNFTCNVTLTFKNTNIEPYSYSTTGVAKNVLYTNITAGIDAISPQA